MELFVWNTGKYLFSDSFIVKYIELFSYQIMSKTHLVLVEVCQGEVSLWQDKLPLQIRCILFPFLPQHPFIETCSPFQTTLFGSFVYEESDTTHTDTYLYMGNHHLWYTTAGGISFLLWTPSFHIWLESTAPSRHWCSNCFFFNFKHVKQK